MLIPEGNMDQPISLEGQTAGYSEQISNDPLGAEVGHGRILKEPLTHPGHQIMGHIRQQEQRFLGGKDVFLPMR